MIMRGAHTVPYLHICPGSSHRFDYTTRANSSPAFCKFAQTHHTLELSAHSECTVLSLYILHTMSIRILLQYNQITGTIKSQMLRTLLIHDSFIKY